MTHARLNAFYPPEFVADQRQFFPVGALAPGMDRTGRPVEISDARALQLAEDVSEAEFLARHGFVLLPHATAVSDWDRDADTVYFPEIERIVRERLFPDRPVEVASAPLFRRGRGTPVPFYADGVHSDGGLDLEDYLFNVEAFAGRDAAQGVRARYEREDVAGLAWVDLWRPTNMSGPLEHMPLALCDVSSVAVEDLVRTGMTGIAPEGRETHHLSLRFNPGQRWYYYPKISCNELIAFKLTEFQKGSRQPRNCFHTAFNHPETPADAEERQSCELRVSVLLLKS